MNATISLSRNITSSNVKFTNSNTGKITSGLLIACTTIALNCTSITLDDNGINQYKIEDNNSIRYNNKNDTLSNYSVIDTTTAKDEYFIDTSESIMTKTEEMIMQLNKDMNTRFNAIEIKLATLESNVGQIKDTVSEIKTDYAKKSDLQIAMLSFKNWIFVTIFGLIAGSIGAGIKELITHLS